VLAESGAALHAAKASGRARVERYDGCVADAHRRALLVERRLRDTLSGAGLAVHYQPVVDLATGAVNGFEALARWDDVVLGTVTPDEFVPVAERTGLIGELGRQVMTRALADLVAMADTVPGGRRLRMAVNVSPVQLRTQSFAAEVQQLVADSGVAAHRVVVEVTEAVFVSENEAAVRQLHELRAYGLQVAIDDFGSGYSSLGYLSRLPATILKVDRSMTAHVTTDGRARTVMRSVVDLGASLPMQVAVEGIETAAMHRLVRGLGATHGQGWLYAPAVPLDRVAETLASIAERRADWDLAVPLQPAVGD
jgi:EAL domain-containing protein (putative c-di-GMP-specific phosphodiesterase class I)